MTGSIKKTYKKLMSHYQDFMAFLYADPLRSMAHQSNIKTDIVTEDFETSSKDRSEFLEQKRKQSTYANQQNTRQELFERGTLSALADSLRTSSKQKTRIRELEKEHKSNRKTIKSCSSTLTKSQEEIVILKKRLLKTEKHLKKMSHKVEDMEKILVLLSNHLKVSSKKASLDDLVADWKHIGRSNKHQ